MIEAFLVPEKTTVTAIGDGTPVEIGAAENRVLLLTLNITRTIEQESLDVTISGSADGAAWDPKPLAVFPQKFYRGQHPLLLDLTQQPQIKFLRAHWEVNRWGRGAEQPLFEFSVTAKEVPAAVLQEVANKVGQAG